MSTITPTQPIESANLSEWIPAPLFRMSLEKYEEMVESGTLTERDRVELINGYLVEKMAQHDPHSTADLLCGHALEKASQPDGMSVRQSPSGFRQTASPNPTGASCAERYGIIASVRPVRRTQAWWSKSPSVALLRIACRPRSMPRPAFRSIGSSTWSPARSKSTPSQGPMVTSYAKTMGPGRASRLSSMAFK